jgi:tetratricopeptide (TPR) repeat protein
LQTAWIEKHGVGAQGMQWSLSLAERCLLAGRALWFYAGKLLWPANLTFIYPRWTLSVAVWWQWLFPVAAAGLLLILFLARQRVGRGAVTGVLFFAGTLGPALGFINVYPMRYSFVADHFQYLAGVGLMTLAAAGISTQLRVLKGRSALVEPVVCGILVVLLAVLTWRQAGMYGSAETLWRATLARNPDCSMAHNNLGNILLSRGQVDEALTHFQKAVEIEPANEAAHDSLGTVLLQKGQTDEAMAHFQQALQIQPDHAGTYYNLGTALLQKGRTDEAIVQFQKALQRRPDDVLTHNNLGNALFRQGRFQEAAVHFQAVLNVQPDDALAHNNLGSALFHDGQIDAAIAQYQRALHINPNFAEAYNNLRLVAWVLATYPEASVRNGVKAVELAEEADRLSGGQNPLMIGTVAAAYAEAGRFADATAAAQRAVQLASSQHDTKLVNDLQTQLKSYQDGQAYRDTIVGSTQ